MLKTGVCCKKYAWTGQSEHEEGRTLPKGRIRGNTGQDNKFIYKYTPRNQGNSLFDRINQCKMLNNEEASLHTST